MYYLKRTGSLETRIYPNTSALLQYLKRFAARATVPDEATVTIWDADGPPRNFLVGHIREALTKLKGRKQHIQAALLWLSVPGISD